MSNTAALRHLFLTPLLAVFGCADLHPTTTPQPGTPSMPEAPDKTSPTPQSPSPYARLTSNDRTYLVLFASDPAPIPLNESFALNVCIFDAADCSAPLSDVTLDVDAAMPAHQHGMIRQPHVRQHPDGSFTANGLLFHMPGHWELYFDVTRQGTTERAQLDINLD